MLTLSLQLVAIFACRLGIGQGSVAQGDVYDESTEIRRVDIPQGFSDFELIVSAERVQKQPGIRDLRIAKLNHLEISDLKLVTQ